jgi:hypothetical protein
LEEAVPAIKLGPGASVTLQNVGFSGFDVGVEGDVGSVVRADGVIFDDVRQPWNMPDAGPSEIRRTRVQNDPKLRKGKHGSFSGWRKPRGAALPVFCPSCKTIFPSQNYVLGGQYWQSWGNKEQCIECGYAEAEVAEGIFDLTKEIVRILSAPDFTHLMLRQVAQIAEDIAKSQITPEEGVKRFENVSPSLGKIVRRALQIGVSAIMLVSAAAGIASMYLAKEQTQLAREQTQIARDGLALQKEANASSDAALEKTLKALEGLRIGPGGVRQEPTRDRAEAPRERPPKSEAPTETGSTKLKVERKPKAREVRRKAMRERRRAMSGKCHCEIHAEPELPKTRVR